MSTQQQRIAELVKHQPERSFTSLNHYLDVDWLRVAFSIGPGEKRLRYGKLATSSI